MYGRRRTAILMPVTRRHALNSFPDCSEGPNPIQADRSCTIRRSRPIGASFLSSSSSSRSGSRSRSSSPPPPPASHRQTNLHPERISQQDIRQLPQRAAIGSRSRSRLISGLYESELASSNQNASSSLIRQVLPMNIKSSTRSRRNCLRSPIFQFILPPTDSNEMRTSATTDANNDNSDVQIIGTERPTNRRLRTTRFCRRVPRNGPIDRRATPVYRFTDSNDLSLHHRVSGRQDTSRSSRTTLNDCHTQAALVAARTPDNTNDDDCVICLCEKSNRSVVVPCMHTFCFQCIYRWLCINPSCPLCKRAAQRIIHSVLSDTEFTELLVSELPNENLLHGSDYLDLIEEYINATPDNGATNRPRHQRRSQTRLFNPLGRSMLLPRALYSNNTNLISDAPTTQTSNTNETTNRNVNSDVNSFREYYRSLLITLVNNALHSRDSSLLDGLLLRQLVYIFFFYSLPARQESELVRDISPEFLATNETCRQRLAQFIRRELRVLAPWLAYESRSGVAVNSAIVDPLIFGASGFENNTPELDELTNRIIQHFCSVSMTDREALVNLLSNQTPFRRSLVHSSYLYHFASEVVQFAQFNGTLEEYDSSVCLYRSPGILGELLDSSTERITDRVAQQSSRPDSSLAVYIASSCWPHMRPGFSQPHGIITIPLIDWLFERLFVHYLFGSSHPDLIHRVGYPPLFAPSSFNSTSRPGFCHPNCLHLESSSYILLALISSFIRFRDRPSRTTGGSNGVPGTNDSISTSLLYQRFLSELIDQARFSEALSEHFGQHGNGGVATGSTANNSTIVTEPNLSTNTSDHMRDIVNAHRLALQRLDGLRLLFSQHNTGSPNRPNLVGDLLHMPLMPMMSSLRFGTIDLTRNSTQSNASQSNSVSVNIPLANSERNSNSLRDPNQHLPSTRRPHNTTSRYGLGEENTRRSSVVSDPFRSGWDFVYRVFPGQSSLSVHNNVCVLSDAETTAMVEENHPLTHATSSHPNDSHLPNAFSVYDNDPLISGFSSDSNWRDANSCVVISSDESDDDDDCVAPNASSAPLSVLTSDESEQMHTPIQTDAENEANPCHAERNVVTGQNVVSLTNNESKRNNSQSGDKDGVQKPDGATSDYSQSSNSQIPSISSSSRNEEPMDVDDKVDEPVLILTHEKNSSFNFQADQSRSKNRKPISKHASKHHSKTSISRHQSKHYHLHFRPIHIDSSDSDCQVTSEFIELDSEDSGTESDCSNYSDVSICPDSKNNTVIFVLRSPNRNYKRRRYKSVYLKSPCRRSNKCCCSCGRIRSKSDRESRSRNMVTNCPSSPIVISDDDHVSQEESCISKDEKIPSHSPKVVKSNNNNNNQPCSTTDCSQSPPKSPLDEQGRRVDKKPIDDPSSTHDHKSLTGSDCDSDQLSKTDSVTSVSNSPVQSSSSQCFLPLNKPKSVKCPIFEPPTASEFYKLLEKFQNKELINCTAEVDNDDKKSVSDMSPSGVSQLVSSSCSFIQSSHGTCK